MCTEGKKEKKGNIEVMLFFASVHLGARTEI